MPLAWSAYGTEACATFAPRVPLDPGHPPGTALGGHGRRPVLHAGDVDDRRPRRRRLLHDLHHRQPAVVDDVVDLGRRPGLFGISRAGMTIEQFGVLNRFHVPARAMSMDLFVNICLPIRIGSGWRPIAGLLCVLDALFPVIGSLAPRLNGYGSWAGFAIGVGILFGSLILFVHRRVVQDGEGVHLREEVPDVPSAEEDAELLGPAPVMMRAAVPAGSASARRTGGSGPRRIRR